MKTVLDVQSTGAGSAGQCHSNAINWWPDLNLYTVSVLNWSSVLAFSRTGTLSWVMGGTAGQTYFPGISWNRQHNHHLLAGSLLIFNNNGSNEGSSVIEFSTSGNSTNTLFDYTSGLASNTLGDAKRLPNGNTLVTYSNANTMHEVNASAQLVRETIFGSGIGYTQRRTTLYGPPPPYAE